MFEGIFQPWHLVLILIIVLIVFGPGKLPEIGGALGKGIREFKRSTREMPEEFGDSVGERRRPVDEAKQLVSVHRDPVLVEGGIQEASRLCSRCSSLNPVTNRFCGNCGAELTGPSAKSVDP